MNAHTGLIGPQALNPNGKIILDWLDKFNLTLLNLNSNCEGEITWSRGDQKSTIDLILTNPEMYNYYKRMKIDEDKEYFDLWDHNQISVDFKIKS